MIRVAFSKEGEGKVSNVQKPMEGEGEASNAWRPMKGEREASFSPFSTSPLNNLLRISSFLLTSRFYFTIVLGRYLHIPSFCPWPINYDVPFNVIGPPHICCRFGLVKDPFFFV
jgi:hypothetical protein